MLTGLPRLLLVTAVCAMLAAILGRAVVRALKTGKVAHTDSRMYCDRRTKPVCFWGLVVLFGAFALASVAVWCNTLYRFVTG